MSEPTDEELAERVRAGDARAFDALVARHLRRAWVVAFRVLGQREDAEDVAQDAFVAALERIGTYQQGRRWAPWFYRIVANRAVNLRKSRAVRRAELLEDEAPSTAGGPDRDAARAELRDRIDAALATLSERQRMIVQFFEVDGFSGAEIAEMLDLSDGTVRWHLHHARAALRQALGAYQKENA